jgi:flagellar hook assembly protein FlgD
MGYRDDKVYIITVDDDGDFPVRPATLNGTEPIELDGEYSVNVDFQDATGTIKLQFHNHEDAALTDDPSGDLEWTANGANNFEWTGYASVNMAGMGGTGNAIVYIRKKEQRL